MYNPPKIIKNPQLPVALIAGGAGFLGSHFAEYLLAKNFRVVVIDNLETGRKDFLTHLFSHPRFGFIEHNLNQGLPEKVESADVVIHLLGEEIYLEGGLEPSFNLLLTNSLATYHLLEFTKDCQAKFLLTSSLNIYQGIVAESSLNHYFGSSSDDERNFSYNESKRYAESLAWEYFKKYSLDIRIARLPEVYGPRMSFASSGALGKLLECLTTGKDLIVFGDGLSSNYYLYVSDAVEGLYNCLVKSGTAGCIFGLCDSSPMTQLEQAYLLKGFSLPGTQIVFRPPLEKSYATDVKNIDRKNLRLIGFKQKVKIREGLKLTLDFLGFSPKVPFALAEVPTPPPGDSKKTAKNPKKIPEGLFNQAVNGPNLFWIRLKKIWISGLAKRGQATIYLVAGFLLFFSPFLLVPPLSLAFHLGQTYWDYRQLNRALTHFDLQKSITQSQSLTTAVADSRTDVSHLLLPSFVKRPYLKVLSAGGDLAQATTSLLLALQSQMPYFTKLAGESSPLRSSAETNNYPYLKAADAASLADQALDDLSLAEAELKDGGFKSTLPFLGPATEAISRKSTQAKTAAQFLRGWVTTAPDLLGFNKTKNYLVLLQNSNELRPTGGFIGALVKITVDGGKLSPLTVEDIYGLDGKIDQQTTFLPAPKILRDNLNIDRLHLRDANFDISFPESSLKIKKLYNLATGQDIDGIVAVDLDLVKSLLKVTGPLFLATYNEEVNADNLFEKVQFHAEAGYVPGGSSKKNFLSILSQKLLEKVVPPQPDQSLGLIKALSEAILGKHLLIQFYFESASSLSPLGLDGEIKNSDGDFFMIVDANVGANKANYYIKRSIAYEAERGNRQGEVNSTLTVSYEHHGTSDAWPGGPYKNFLRILVPRQASLLKVIRVSPADTAGAPDQEEDLTGTALIDEEGGKTSFGLLFELKSGAKTQIVWRYVLPPAAFSLASNNYHLLIQKQPGVSGDSLRAKFILPFGTNFEDNLAQGFTRQGNSVIYESVLNKDLEINIPLSQK